ncbi:MAG TPA: adenylosuccinate lyase [Longimicrobiales bacterium]|nr:adenylosuccinate lyase [Longimicrobiales bacterium]
MDRIGALLERIEATGANAEYRHPLSERYASGEMIRIFSPAFKFGTWRRLWLILAEAEKELGLEIPDEAIAAMRDHLDDIDLARAAEHERRLRHDVMAHVHHFGDVAPAARRFIHLGATSCFVTDNTELLQHREALRLVRRRLLATIAALAGFAREHRALPTLGFTHFQPAQPTTVGKRAALWLQDLVLDLEEVDHRLATLRARSIRGATGTQASFMELFDGDAAKVEELQRRVTAAMGFEADYAVTGQTYSRKVDYAALSTLAGIGASTSKFAHDIRLLAHLREVEEPFEAEQIGSSAMPYKRNPMRAERITGLARHVITLSLDAGFTAATQWLERTLDDSANRRLSIPEAYLTTDAILLLVHNVAGGLVVRPGVIRRRLEQELPFLATEAVLMHATRRGGDRQDLHERIRRHAMAAADRLKEEGGENDMPERIAADRSFGMSADEVRGILDPHRHVGRAAEQVDAFLKELEPVLEEARSSGEVSGAPELRA